ncbi:hypothetical protein KSW81_004278 [Nannochloris sp. 'desiccata']|nr:hypothetical protein KSW81_004278 [Chlorella desiccata (nom. nud.)]
MGILNFKRRRQVADDAFESDLTPEQSSQYQAEDHDGMQRLKPVVRTYLYKPDAVSLKRYVLLFSAWVAGTAAPAYEQVGPYTFKIKEVRYNLEYSANWTEVEFSYHQYATLMPEYSCPTCTLNASITGVNRGYLQFLAAPPAGPVDQESGVIYQLMPITLSVIRDSIVQAVTLANPASTTIQEDSVAQWTDCSFLLPLVPFLGLSTPYLKDIPLPPGAPGFPYNPELCAYIPEVLQSIANLTVAPADFGAFGLAIDKTAAATFLQLAIGQSNSTYVDPAASQFIGAFLTLPQETLLDSVAAVSPPAEAALTAITAPQWLLLQGYIASLVPTWGSLVFSQWLSVGGGGMITTKTVESWLYGFEDPLLLAAAQGMATSAGDPEAYRLSPWIYTPSIGVTFSTKNAPMEYFEQVTGQAYNFSMLTWNSSDIGYFNPLIQQKRIFTGKGQADAPQEILQYRGIPFESKQYGILNMTGINEAVAFGMNVDTTAERITFDSVLARAVSYKVDVKKVTALVYNMTNESTAACNMTYYGTWAGTTGFDPDNYLTAIEDIPESQYWALMRNDTALSEYFEDSTLGSTLAPYFENMDVYRERCANPEAFQGMWDMSKLLACPTIYTFPHFLGSGEVVVESTGSNLSTWAPDALQHGYSIGVEPLTGFAIQGHKTYQVNHLVSATANLYPNLWVAPGTAAATGLASDFVTVPAFWAKMWWEPTDSAALLLRGIIIAEDILYYVLVLSFPVVGWAMLGSALFILKFGKDGKVRVKALKRIQESKARKVLITNHEQEMVRGLSRIARGSIGVVLPQPISEGLSEAGEYHNPTLEELEAGDAAAGGSAGKKEKTVIEETTSQEIDQGRATWNTLDVEAPKMRIRSPRVAPVVEPPVGASCLVIRANGSSRDGGSSSSSSSSSREEPLLHKSSGSLGNSSAGSETLLLKSDTLPSSSSSPLGAGSSPRGNTSGGSTGNKWQQINESTS